MVTAPKIYTFPKTYINVQTFGAMFLKEVSFIIYYNTRKIVIL